MQNLDPVNSSRAKEKRPVSIPQINLIMFPTVNEAANISSNILPPWDFANLQFYQEIQTVSLLGEATISAHIPIVVHPRLRSTHPGVPKFLPATVLKKDKKSKMAVSDCLRSPVVQRTRPEIDLLFHVVPMVSLLQCGRKLYSLKGLRRVF
ncbi:MAG: hypothetical protein OXC63_01890 [Aestuariivita sp.]|nr:hypothetical protein [Aestuariivita sp.]